MFKKISTTSLLVLVLFGCSPQGPDEEVPDPPISEDVVNIDEVEEVEVEEVLPDEIIFDADGVEDLDLQPGDILVGTSEGAFGRALLRKVSNVEESGNSIVVETEDASLRDAIREGVLDSTVVIDFEFATSRAEGRVGYVHPSITQDRILDYSGIHIDFSGETLFSAGGIEITLVEDSGFDFPPPELDFGAQFSWLGGVEEFHAILTPMLELRLNALAVATLADYEGSHSLPLITDLHPAHPIIFTIHGFPVEVMPYFDLDLMVDWGFNASITATGGVEVEETLSAGIRYQEDVGWTLVNSRGTDPRIIPVQVEGQAEANVRLTLRPKITLLLYEYIGPLFALRPYAELGAEIHTYPQSEMCLDIALGIAGDAGVDLSRIDFDWLEIDWGDADPDGDGVLEWELFDASTIIWEDCLELCSDPPSSPTGPSPGHNTTGVSIGLSQLSWSGGDSSCPDQTAQYDVYFGDSNPPHLVATNLVNKEWPFDGGLSYGQSYYWKVEAKDDYGTTPSSVWKFTTGDCPTPPTSPTSPSPSNGSTGVAGTTDLSWQSGDSQCGNSVCYKVYFGTDSTPDSGEFQETVCEKSWDPPENLSEGVQYYWKIVAVDQGNSEEEASSVWSFTTASCQLPPTEPTNPTPTNGAGNVSVSTNISWQGGSSQCGNTVKHKVYFGTDSTPDSGEFQGLQESNSWNPPGNLDEDVTYYWQIITVDQGNDEEKSGPVWSFTTANCQLAPTTPSSPSPANGSTDVAVTTNLSWQGGDSQCGNTVCYEVYFGTDSTPDSGEYQETVCVKSWDPPGNLTEGVHYYWKIVAIDQGNDQETGGEVWDFTTSDCQLSPTQPSNPSPLDGASDVSVSTSITWLGGSSQCGNSVEHMVYFGTDSTPDSEEYQGLHTSSSWNPPGNLDHGTLYYWKIITVDQGNYQETAGPVWDFTTEQDTTPGWTEWSYQQVTTYGEAECGGCNRDCPSGGYIGNGPSNLQPAAGECLPYTTGYAQIFSWDPYPDAIEYEFKLYGTNCDGVPTVETWSIPGSQTHIGLSFQHNNCLDWQVRALVSGGGGEPLSDGNFENGPCWEGSSWTCTTNTECNWILDPISAWGYPAYEGTYCAWLGGFCGVPNSNSFCQDVYIDARYLDWYWMGYVNYACATARVRIDGSMVFAHSMEISDHTYGTWNSAGGTIAPAGGVDLNSYIGGTHELCFDWSRSGCGEDQNDNMLIDMVTLSSSRESTASLPRSFPLVRVETFKIPGDEGSGPQSVTLKR